MAIYKEVKLFKGLKNDEDQKQMAEDYFYNIKNFNYPESGILGINKILMPEVIKVFLSPNLEENISDTILITGDTISDNLDANDSKWGTNEWGYSVWE